MVVEIKDGEAQSPVLVKRVLRQWTGWEGSKPNN